MSILNELNQISKRYSSEFLGQKAMRISMKAMRNGKSDLSKAIDSKYVHLYPKSDFAMAASILLVALQKNSTNDNN